MRQQLAGRAKRTIGPSERREASDCGDDFKTASVCVVVLEGFQVTLRVAQNLQAKARTRKVDEEGGKYTYMTNPPKKKKFRIPTNCSRVDLIFVRP